MFRLGNGKASDEGAGLGPKLSRIASHEKKQADGAAARIEAARLSIAQDQAISDIAENRLDAIEQATAILAEVGLA